MTIKTWMAGLGGCLALGATLWGQLPPFRQSPVKPWLQKALKELAVHQTTNEVKVVDAR